MKAILLAAGMGKRLRPITNKIPKCLVPIGGKPILHYWLKLFEEYGVNEVLINLHHLPEKVNEFIASYKTSLRITTVYEHKLLGSAGTVLANKKWVGNERSFIIAYSDNLTNLNLKKMIDFHEREHPVATLGLFETSEPEQCGVVEMDDKQTIWNFIEKSSTPSSHLANAGIYIGSQKLFDFIPEKHPADFGFDVFPKMLGKMKGYKIDEYLLDIGTMYRYRQAQIDIERLIFGGR